MIYFVAHTFNCVFHCIRAMFRVLDMYFMPITCKSLFNIPYKFLPLQALVKLSYDLCNQSGVWILLTPSLDFMTSKSKTLTGLKSVLD